MRNTQRVPDWGLRNHPPGPSAECRDGLLRRVRAGQQILTACRGGPRASARGALAILVVLALVITPTLAADKSKASNAAKEIEAGAKKIGEGVTETTEGIGRTVTEGAKETGERFKAAGKAAKPPAKSAWENVKEGASSFGQTVKNFFSELFGQE